MVSWRLGFLVYWFLGSLVSLFFGFFVSKVLSVSISEFLGFLVSWFRRFLASQSLGFLSSKCQVSKIGFLRSMWSGKPPRQPRQSERLPKIFPKECFPKEGFPRECFPKECFQAAPSRTASLFFLRIVCRFWGQILARHHK